MVAFEAQQLCSPYLGDMLLIRTAGIFMESSECFSSVTDLMRTAVKRRFPPEEKPRRAFLYNHHEKR